MDTTAVMTGLGALGALGAGLCVVVTARSGLDLAAGLLLLPMAAVYAVVAIALHRIPAGIATGVPGDDDL